MHSSRMRTACSLTVSRSIPGGGGLPSPHGCRLLGVCPPPPNADPLNADPSPWMQTSLNADPPWMQTPLDADPSG